MCDIPEKLAKNMLNFIKETIKPDVTLWSGDSVPHNIGTLTLDSNVEQIKKVT